MVFTLFVKADFVLEHLPFICRVHTFPDRICQIKWMDGSLGKFYCKMIGKCSFGVFQPSLGAKYQLTGSNFLVNTG